MHVCMYTYKDHIHTQKQHSNRVDTPEFISISFRNIAFRLAVEIVRIRVTALAMYEHTHMYDCREHFSATKRFLRAYIYLYAYAGMGHG